MQINVAQQLKSPVGDIRCYSLDDTTRDGYHVRGEARLVRTDRSILVTGQFRSAVSCDCSRCLDPFECPLSFEMEEEFFPVGGILNKQEGFLFDDPSGFIVGGDHILDLSEAVRQNILISLPAKPLCQAECVGLCQRCGYNLNYGPCHCVGEHGDPCWAPLGALLSSEIAGDHERGLISYGST